MSENELESFQAVDEDGEVHTLRVLQSWIDADTHDGNESLPGLKRIVDASGRNVIRQDANTFVLHTRQVLTRK